MLFDKVDEISLANFRNITFVHFLLFFLFSPSRRLHSYISSYYTLGYKESIWLTRMRSGLGVSIRSIKVDNAAALQLASKNSRHEGTKHIDIRYHHIRGCIEERKGGAISGWLQQRIRRTYSPKRFPESPLRLR